MFSKPIRNITTLVLPVGGLGTRLHPLTIHTPKALVKVAGRPLLDYMLIEARDAKIKDVVLVIKPYQRAAFEKYVRRSRTLFPSLKFHIKLQYKPLGDGHAVAQAADIVKNRPFAVRFCDDIVLGRVPALTHLIAHERRQNGSVVLLERVPKKIVSRYGVVGARKIGKRLYRIFRIVEKPVMKDAPSNLTIVGGYVFMPSIMRRLKLAVRALSSKEKDVLRLAFVLEDGLAKKEKIFGWELEGVRLDCGTLEGIARAEKYIRKSGKRW